MSTTTPRLLLCATLATLAACGSGTPVSVESALLQLTASGAVSEATASCASASATRSARPSRSRSSPASRAWCRSRRR